MARSFSGGQYLASSQVPATNVTLGLTISCWARSAIPGAAYTRIALSQGTADWQAVGENYTAGLLLDWNDAPSPGVVTLTTNLDSGGAVRAATKQISGAVNTWRHFCGTFYNLPTRLRAYVDGASQASSYGSFFTQLDYEVTLINRYRSSTASLVTGSNAELAEVAMWSVELSADEITSLSKGFSPLLVRPQDLVFYAPLHGRALPELDQVSGLQLSSYGSPPTNTASPPPGIIRQAVFPVVKKGLPKSDRSAAYFVQSPRQADRPAAYLVQSTGSISMAAEYRVGNLPVNLSATYKVQAPFTADRVAAYAVLKTLSLDRIGQYIVLRPLYQDSRGVYAVQSTQTRDKAAVYEIRFYKDLKAQYVVKTPLQIQGMHSEISYSSVPEIHIEGLTQEISYQPPARSRIQGLLVEFSYKLPSEIVLDRRAEYKVAWYADRKAQYYVRLVGQSDKKAEYVIKISGDINLRGSYSVRLVVQKDTVAQYLVRKVAQVDKTAQYYLRSSGTKDLGANYVVESATFSDQAARYYVKTTPILSKRGQYHLSTETIELKIKLGATTIVTVPHTELEVPGSTAEDLFLKGPYSLYFSLGGVIRGAPKKYRAKMRGDGIVYSWEHTSGFSGTFEYRQDLMPVLEE